MLSASEAGMNELVLGGEGRPDPTLHLNQNDSKLNFSQSSPCYVMEIFLTRHPDFMLHVFLLQMGLEGEAGIEGPVNSLGATAKSERMLPFPAVPEAVTSGMFNQTIHKQ